MAAKGLISTRSTAGLRRRPTGEGGDGGGHWRVCPLCFYIWVRGICSSACPNRMAALRGANQGPRFSVGGRTHAGGCRCGHRVASVSGRRGGCRDCGCASIWTWIVTSAAAYTGEDVCIW